MTVLELMIVLAILGGGVVLVRSGFRMVTKADLVESATEAVSEMVNPTATPEADAPQTTAAKRPRSSATKSKAPAKKAASPTRSKKKPSSEV